MIEHSTRKKTNRYRFTIIRYRNTLLGQPDVDIPLAVVVETEDGREGFILGCEPKLPSIVSDISKSVIKKFPEILSEQLSEAKKEKTPKRVIQIFSENLKWNIYVTSEKPLQVSCGIEEVAFSIFNSQVSELQTKAKSVNHEYDVKRDDIFRLKIPVYA